MKVFSSYTDQDILIIGETLPRNLSDINRTVFSDGSGHILTKLLGELNLKSVGLIELAKEHFEEELPEDVLERVSLVNLTANKCTKIIILGGKVAKALLPTSMTRNMSVSKMSSLPPSMINETEVAVVMHPNFIRKSDDNDEAYSNWKTRFLEIINGLKPQKFDLAHIITNCKIKILSALSALHSHTKDIGFDVETNAEDPWTPDFQLTGFSLAIKTGEFSGKSFYFDLRKLDQDPEIKQACATLFKLKQNQIWTYNSRFEISVVWRWLGIFCEFNDSMILVIEDHRPGSLKINSRRYLRADIWEDGTYEAINVYETLFNALNKNKYLQSNKKELDHFLKTGNFDVTLSKLESEHVQYLLDHPRKKKTDFVTPAWIEDLETQISTIKELYGEEEGMLGVECYPYHWRAVPGPILGEYCCYDSFYTLLLKEKLWPVYEKQYYIYTSQFKLSAVFEAFGLPWDDQRATELDKYYLQEQMTTLATLITYLDTSEEEKMRAKDIMSFRLPFDVSYESGEKTVKFTVSTEWERHEALKGIFNPGSPAKANKDKFWNSYLTPEMEALCMFYAIDQELKVRGVHDHVKNLIDYTDIDTSLNNLISYSDDKKIEGLVNLCIVEGSESYKNMLYKFSKEVFDPQYEVHKYLRGLKIADKSTWNREFTMLYLLVRYKKMNKSRTTYIDGRVGRQSVYLAELDLENLYTIPPRRIEPYVWGKDYSNLPPNQCLIMNTTFNPNSADTKRWRSPIHTVPSGSEIRSIYKTRDPFGFSIHADYSQMELCVVARLANDENMIQAFKDGKDIHRFVASRMFNKPESEVTGEQRRYAKALSFGLLYGKGIESIAREMMGGDIAAAQKLFDDFYTAFPGVAAFVKQKHEEVDKYGLVYTMFGDVLRIDTSAAGGRAHRIAVNAPIQSSASSLAGYHIWRLYEASQKAQLQAIQVGFTHDAKDSEVNGRHLFDYVDLFFQIMQKDIFTDFGIPARLDWEVGVTQVDQMSMSIVKKDAERVYITFSGTEVSVNQIVDRLRQIYKEVLVKIESQVEEAGDLEEMFVTKRAFSNKWGSTWEEIKGKMIINLEVIQ